jgi:hypothetical protein
MANGTNFPSGSAPLFLGSFNSNRAAMMQKMTDRMIEQADKERTQQSKERADMLKALSFDAVAGLGRKAQEAHLNELEGLQDKWSRKWIENGKKLTDRDYMELERDKVNMQQKVANMKHNVAQYGYHAKTLMEHPELYHPSTVAGMKQYYEGGDVGKDISEVVRYMPDTSSYLGKRFGNLRTTKGSENKGAYSPDNNSFETTYSNRKQVEDIVEAGLKNDQYHQSLINSGDPYVVKMALEDKKNFIDANTIETTGFKSATAADLKRMETKSLPEDIKGIEDNTGWVAGGLDPGHVKSMALLNDEIEKIYQHDANAIDKLRSANFSEIGGTPGRVDVMDNGDIRLSSQRKDKDGNPTETYTLQQPIRGNAYDTERQKRKLAIALAPQYFKDAKDRPKNIENYIEADWKTEIGEKKMPIGVEAIKDILDIDYSKLGKDTADRGNLLGKEERKILAKNINTLFPDKADAEMEKGVMTGNRWLNWDGDKFNLKDPKEAQRLMDKITKERNVKNIVLKGTQQATTKTTTPEPVEDDDPLNIFK